MSDDAPPKVIFAVPAPFTADCPGDCLLKSADGHMRKVFRNILALGSTVFADMFSLLQGIESQASEGNTDLPVITLSEDAHILHPLLLCSILVAAKNTLPGMSTSSIISLSLMKNTTCLRPD